MSTRMLEDDQKNRFDKHNEVRKKANADSTDRDRRIKAQEAMKERWQRQELPRATGGTTLDPELAKLKAAAYSKPKAPEALPAPTDTDLAALAALYVRLHPEYFVCELNYRNIENCILRQIAGGKRITYELFEAAVSWLDGHNYIDHGPQGPRKRTEAATPAPLEYPRFISEAEREEATREEAEEAAMAREREAIEAKKMPFDKLKQKVQGSQNRGRDGGVI